MHLLIYCYEDVSCIWGPGLSCLNLSWLIIRLNTFFFFWAQQTDTSLGGVPRVPPSGGLRLGMEVKGSPQPSDAETLVWIICQEESNWISTAVSCWEGRAVGPCITVRCSGQTCHSFCSISFSWELVRNAVPALPQTYWTGVCTLQDPRWFVCTLPSDKPGSLPPGCALLTLITQKS